MVKLAVQGPTPPSTIGILLRSALESAAGGLVACAPANIDRTRTHRTERPANVLRDLLRKQSLIAPRVITTRLRPFVQPRQPFEIADPVGFSGSGYQRSLCLCESHEYTFYYCHLSSEEQRYFFHA